MSILPHFDLMELISTVGYIGLFAIVFAESGLFFGFFLPGDSLLFTAGILASQGILSIWILIPLLFVAAVLGDNVGYWTGRKLGSWLMKQKDSFFFKKHHLLKAQRFYEQHGGKTLILARFMPAIRTFAPIAAGMAQMHYNTFFMFNIIGGAIWAIGMTVLGFFLGNIIPDIEKYLLPVIAAIVVISVVPALSHLKADVAEEPIEGEGFSWQFRAKQWWSKVTGRN